MAGRSAGAWTEGSTRALRQPLIGGRGRCSHAKAYLSHSTAATNGKLPSGCSIVVRISVISVSIRRHSGRQTDLESRLDSSASQ